MGKTFARVKLCHTNDFAPSINDKIKRWVENNGGTYQTELALDTTHLLCSLSAWKNYHELVRQARRQNRGLSEKRKIKIVRFGWLEDSLLTKSRKPKDTIMYEFEQRKLQQNRTDIALGHKTQTQTIRAIETATHAVERDRKNTKSEQNRQRVDQAMKEFDAACAEFEADMGEGGYHPYSDQTAFIYLIVLARHDVLKNSIERHRLKVRYNHSFSNEIHETCPIHLYYFPRSYPLSLHSVSICPRQKKFSRGRVRVPFKRHPAQSLQLFESDSIPHRYACYTAYTNGKPGFQKVLHTLAEPGSSWDFAWGMFRRFFQLKTGVEWGSRPEVTIKTDKWQQDGSGDFNYIAPGNGKPQGYRYGLANDASAESVGGSEGGRSVGVTRPVPPIEADDRVWKQCAKTPEGGW